MGIEGGDEEVDKVDCEGEVEDVFGAGDEEGYADDAGRRIDR